MSGYVKHVEHRFEVLGEMFAIVAFDPDWVMVEEVRKNGQEDTHMSGELVLCSEWEWAEGEGAFVRYGSRELADGIVDYLRRWGVPE